MSKPVRISEEYHDEISRIAESGEKSIQEVVDSLVGESIEIPEPEGDEVVGRCPYTGEIYTQDEVSTYPDGDYVCVDLPNHVAVEDLKPVEGA